jgi:hypothetical protein
VGSSDFDKDSLAVSCLEAELLFCCSPISSDSDRAAQLRALLNEDLDWASLLRIAHRHGVVPLLFWHLSKTSPEGVPTTVLDRLRADFHANNLRNLSLTRELLKLLSMFEAQGISAIPYKGPALAAFTYGNLALRQFIDLDILVRKHDVSRAKDLLVSAGYRPEDQMTHAQEAALLQYKHERLFRHVADGSMVELHWGIIDRQFSFPLDPEHLWGRLDWVPLGSSTVTTLSPEDLHLILCVHGSVHL